MGLLMSAGFLHSNGNCPDSLTLFFSSSDRPRSDRPVPKALLACSTAARYQSLAPSHCPAAPRLHFPSTASSTRIHSQPATHPRTHALIIFETRQIYSTASLAASSDHHQCFCCIVFLFLDSTEEQNKNKKKKLDPCSPLTKIGHVNPCRH